MNTKIITTVGTSLFENYAKSDEGKKKSTFKSVLDDLKDKAYPFDKWEDRSVKSNLSKLEVLKDWSKDNVDASAEIKSILKIKEANAGTVEVYLLATDTVLSKKASDLIEKSLNAYQITTKTNEVIKGLNIENANDFIDKGVQNLIESILNIYESEEDAQVILNISGGFKAMIPILTIVGQLYNIPLYYIYENSDTPIEIQRLPINFDWDVIESYSDYLAQPKLIVGNEDIAESMIKLHLVRKAESAFELTVVGQLILKFLKRRPPLFDTTFGYLVEYKIKECFDKEFGCTNVLHGYKSANNSFQGDLDLILMEGNEMETIEVKPLNLLDKPDSLKGFMAKLIERTKVAKAELSKQPKKLTLMVYKFMQTGDADIYQLAAEQLAVIKEVESSVKEEFTDAAFVVKCFYVTPNKIKKGNRLLHQQFLKNALQFNKINTIFPQQ